MGDAASADLDARTRALREAIPLFDAMDLRVVVLEAGRAVVEAPFAPNRNHVGIVYAGSLFSMAEVLGGLIPSVTWECAGYVPIVSGVDIQFLRPATRSVRAVAVVGTEEIDRVAGELREGAERIWFTIEAEVSDQERVVAKTSGRYLLRRVAEGEAR